MAKTDDELGPDAATSLRHFFRLASLWRGGDFAGGLNPVQWEALRYLETSNRFSRTSGALTRYLGATKGTVSQTVQALEKKGLVAKGRSADDHRSRPLELTAKAQALLAEDHRHAAVAAVETLRPKVQRRFAQALDALVADEALQQGLASFGTCGNCRWFREAPRGEQPHCMAFESPLTEAETALICVSHQAR